MDAASIHRLAALIGLALLLAACQASPTRMTGGKPEAGWQVVERLGAVRFEHPGEAASGLLRPGDRVRPGSRIRTGRDGRVILAQGGRQIVADAGAVFRLPAADAARPLIQEQGEIRYRVAGEAGSAGPLAVETPHLVLENLAGVVTVEVGSANTEIELASGETDLRSPDGSRRAELAVGGRFRSDWPWPASAPAKPPAAPDNQPEDDRDRLLATLSRPAEARAPVAEPDAGSLVQRRSPSRVIRPAANPRTGEPRDRRKLAAIQADYAPGLELPPVPAPAVSTEAPPVPGWSAAELAESGWTEIDWDETDGDGRFDGLTRGLIEGLEPEGGAGR